MDAEPKKKKHYEQPKQTILMVQLNSKVAGRKNRFFATYFYDSDSDLGLIDKTKLKPSIHTTSIALFGAHRNRCKCQVSFEYFEFIYAKIQMV